MKQKHKKWSDLSENEKAYYLEQMTLFMGGQTTVDEVKQAFSYSESELREVMDD